MVQVHLEVPRAVEKWLTHLAHNQEIGGSNPPCATILYGEIKPNKLKTHTAIFSFKKIFSSLVEHLSVKQNVVGSNPTIFSFASCIWAGDIRGRCAGLKIRERWFDSTPAHHLIIFHTHSPFNNAERLLKNHK